MSDIWNKKVQVELTVRELEEITLALRMVNKAFGNGLRSELEDRLSHVTVEAKMSL